MDDRRKWLLLGALLTILIGLGAVRLLSSPEPQRVPLTFKTGQTSVATRPTDTSGVARIVRPKHTKPLESPGLHVTNIFAPIGTEPASSQAVKLARARESKPVVPMVPATKAVVTGMMFGPERPPPAALPPPGPPQPSPEELLAQQLRQQQEAAQQQARQKLGQFRFLGYVTEGGEQRAFLGKGRELYIVRTGEMVEGRIRVSTIEPTSVKLTDGETGVGTTLPLVKDSGGPS